MSEVIDETVGPGVIVRRAPGTDLLLRPAAPGQTAAVGISQGAVWARADGDSGGVDLGHGSVTALIRTGTVLFDAHGGSGLVIALDGSVEVRGVGGDAVTAAAGEALAFDALGAVSAPDPVDAGELAQDPFVRLNLVLDALAGVPWCGPGAPTPIEGAAEPTVEEPDGRRRSMFGSRRRD